LTSNRSWGHAVIEKVPCPVSTKLSSGSEADNLIEYFAAFVFVIVNFGDDSLGLRVLLGPQPAGSESFDDCLLFTTSMAVGQHATFLRILQAKGWILVIMRRTPRNPAWGLLTPVKLMRYLPAVIPIYYVNRGECREFE
jgi:hypothetical protein